MTTAPPAGVGLNPYRSRGRPAVARPSPRRLSPARRHAAVRRRTAATGLRYCAASASRRAHVVVDSRVIRMVLPPSGRDAPSRRAAGLATPCGCGDTHRSWGSCYHPRRALNAAPHAGRAPCRGVRQRVMPNATIGSPGRRSASRLTISKGPRQGSISGAGQRPAGLLPQGTRQVRSTPAVARPVPGQPAGRRSTGRS